MVTARNASVSETACSGPTTDPSTLHLRVTAACTSCRVPMLEQGASVWIVNGRPSRTQSAAGSIRAAPLEIDVFNEKPRLSAKLRHVLDLFGSVNRTMLNALDTSVGNGP